MLLLATNIGDDDHDTGPHHPERPARLGAALEGIGTAGLDEAVVTLDPRLATEEELALVHPLDYLRKLEAFCGGGGGHLDADTPAGPGSWDTSRRAVGAALAAVDALDGGTGDVAFVAARPPGHHMGRDRPMGFCLLNTVAVAAAALADRGQRVLVLDWDVHHGNGTQEIFWDDPRVLYASTHEWPLYPGTGRLEETGGPGAPGLTVNIPLPAGSAGDDYRRAFDEVLTPAVEAFLPDWVLVSAGFDAHRADPLADIGLTAGDFADLALRARAFAPGPGRLALVLEGGYDLDALRLSVGASLAALLGVDFRPEPASSAGTGAAAVDRAVRALRG